MTDTIADAYRASLESWGGVTIHLASMQEVTPSTGYAVAVTDTLSIPHGSDSDTFTAAMRHALEEFTGHDYMGVFHDDEKGTVEFNGVRIVDTVAEVDELAKHFPIAGGAYEFATGNGYWPTEVKA